MLKPLFIGIDPGLTGAVAIVDSRGEIISLQDTPTIVVKKGKGKRHVFLETQMATLLENSRDSGSVQVVAIENVHAMPKQGVTSSFNFGVGFGLWLGILAALRLPIQKVEPAKWKREMGIATGSDKAQSIVRVLQLFPCADIYLAKHDGRADALLLAEWVRRSLGGK